mgnify:CR=1 FL=1
MEKKQGIGFFEKYLTIWVALCIIIWNCRGTMASGNSANIKQI